MLFRSPELCRYLGDSIDDIRQAADQGDAEAQVDLGSMYDEGDDWMGIAEDHDQAVHWYRLAADQGDTWAQYNLGLMYDEGRGVPQDDAQAVSWMRQAAEQGDKDALDWLDLMLSPVDDRPLTRQAGANMYPFWVPPLA